MYAEMALTLVPFLFKKIYIHESTFNFQIWSPFRILAFLMIQRLFWKKINDFKTKFLTLLMWILLEAFHHDVHWYTPPTIPTK